MILLPEVMVELRVASSERKSGDLIRVVRCGVRILTAAGIAVDRVSQGARGWEQSYFEERRRRELQLGLTRTRKRRG